MEDLNVVQQMFANVGLRSPEMRLMAVFGVSSVLVYVVKPSAFFTDQGEPVWWFANGKMPWWILPTIAGLSVSFLI